MTPPSTMMSPREPIRMLRDVIATPVCRERCWSRPLLECEDAVPVPFHINHDPSHCGCCIQRLVEPPEIRFAVIGVFALGIGVVNQHSQMVAGACPRCPLQ